MVLKIKNTRVVSLLLVNQNLRGFRCHRAWLIKYIATTKMLYFYKYNFFIIPSGSLFNSQISRNQCFINQEKSNHNSCHWPTCCQPQPQLRDAAEERLGQLAVLSDRTGPLQTNRTGENKVFQQQLYIFPKYKLCHLDGNGKSGSAINLLARSKSGNRIHLP